MTPTKEKSSLLSLAERVEAVAGPDRELDAEIMVATGYDLPAPMGECKARYRMPSGNLDYEHVEPGHCWLVQMSGLSLRSAPKFTASLDAALLLAPNDLFPGVSQNVHHGDWHAWLGDLDADGPLTRGEAHAWHPALALTAACLRAISGGKSE